MNEDRPVQGILDTSTVILLPQLNAATSLPLQPLITAVTLAELSVAPLVASGEEERAARQAHLQQAEADFDPLAFDGDAARAFAQVASSLRRADPKTKPRTSDAMIAAIAVAHDLPLYTCNPADFSGIAGLQVFSVAHRNASTTSS